MTATEAKQKVMAVYPEARAEKSPEWSEEKYWCVFSGPRAAGCMGHALNPDDAWITAASRLPESKPEPPKGDETCTYGADGNECRTVGCQCKCHAVAEPPKCECS